LTRDRIIEAAAVLADEHGFESVTLAQLARLFDVRLASLYSHLANVGDLKQGLALRALSTLADRAEEAVAGRSGRDALVAFANVHRDFARDHPGLFEAARYPLDPKTAAESSGSRLARVSLAMLRSYDISETDRIHAVRLIGAFVLGFSLLERAGSYDHRPPETETSWQRGLGGLDALIQSWAKA
jgi:AcrR family transcriptional regulator